MSEHYRACPGLIKHPPCSDIPRIFLENSDLVRYILLAISNLVWWMFIGVHGVMKCTYIQFMTSTLCDALFKYVVKMIQYICSLFLQLNLNLGFDNELLGLKWYPIYQPALISTRK